MRIMIADQNVDDVILDKVIVIIQLTNPKMWGCRGLERYEERYTCTVFNFHIGDWTDSIQHD